MSNKSSHLTQLRRLKSASKEMSVEEIREAIARLQVILTKRETAEKEDLALTQAKKQKIDAVIEKMSSMGLTLDDLGLNARKERKVYKQREPMAPKYKIESHGEIVKWTGMGRIPKVFKAQIEAGRSIDEFLI